jgi:hypothetical protein
MTDIHLKSKREPIIITIDDDSDDSDDIKVNNPTLLKTASAILICLATKSMNNGIVI